MEASDRKYAATLLLAAFALALVVFAITEYPYRYADHHAPEGSRFIGQIAMTDDINSYYSFIRQAANGHHLFRNTMTHQEHAPAFVNLEWSAIGVLMSVFGWSTRTTFEAWRLAGAVFLLCSFAALSLTSPLSQRERAIALIMCALGGGFGWFLAGLSRFGWIDPSAQSGIVSPAMDLITGMHAFAQITKNPHFSLPHGTFLLVMAAFAMAEHRNSPRWYAISAAAAVLHGLIRPYDLISLWAILPAFMAVESLRARSWCVRQNVWRACTLLATAPLLLYYVYIFSWHPVFKYWSSQGVQPAIPLGWHLFALGLAGALFAWRLVCLRTNPFVTSSERLFAVWALVTLALIHSNRLLPFMPYSPQLGVPLVTPMILLGVAVFRPRDTDQPGDRKLQVLGIAAAFLLVNSLTSPLLLHHAARAAASDENAYLRTADLEAIDWLNAHVREHDVIVSTYAMGTKLGQLVSARVALGHWALTPHVDALARKVDAVLDGKSSPAEAVSLLSELHTHYLYVSSREHWARAYPPGAIPELRLVYENPAVAIYEAGPQYRGLSSQDAVNEKQAALEAAWQ